MGDSLLEIDGKLKESAMEILDKVIAESNLEKEKPDEEKPSEQEDKTEEVTETSKEPEKVESQEQSESEPMETNDAPIVVQAQDVGNQSEPKTSQEDEIMTSDESDETQETNSPKESVSNGAKTDENLLSEEHLDRESPEIWPEKIPGVQDFVQEHANETEGSPPTWTKGLTQDDIDQMHELGAMTNAQLILEIKKLYDHAYKIGIEEAKEMSRGKILQIFLHTKKK